MKTFALLFLSSNCNSFNSEKYNLPGFSKRIDLVPTCSNFFAYSASDSIPTQIIAFEGAPNNSIADDKPPLWTLILNDFSNFDADFSPRPITLNSKFISIKTEA